MTVFNRLIVPASFMPILLPVVFLNLVVQLLHVAGVFDYDGEKASYIISAAYLVSVAKEATSLWQEQKTT
jgi:hypothetical protein